MTERDLNAFSRIAATQHGLVTRRQVLALVRPHELTLALESAALVPVHAGVYLVPDAPDTFSRRVLAAVLAAGGATVASHRSAAQVLDLECIEAALEITVPPEQRPRVAGVKVYRRSPLPRDHLTARHGIPVTNETRTICDLAGVLERDPLALGLDMAPFHGRTTCPRVREMLASIRQAPGAATLVALLDQRPDGRARNESPLEQKLDLQLEAAGFAPARQHRLMLPRYGVAYVDFAFVEQRLAIETDGFAPHGTRESFQRDRARDAALVQIGWRVLRFTARDVDSRAALRRINEVLAAIAPH